MHHFFNYFREFCSVYTKCFRPIIELSSKIELRKVLYYESYINTLCVVHMYTCQGNVMGRIVLLSRFKQRDRANIVLDVLDTIRRNPKGKTKTSIMRDANLNFGQVNKYLDHLLVNGLIKTGNPIGTQELVRYKLTEKGVRTASHLHSLRDIFR